MLCSKWELFPSKCIRRSLVDYSIVQIKPVENKNAWPYQNIINFRFSYQICELIRNNVYQIIDILCTFSCY